MPANLLCDLEPHLSPSRVSLQLRSRRLWSFTPSPKIKLCVPNPAPSYLEVLQVRSLAPPSSSFSFNSWLNSFPFNGFFGGSCTSQVLPAAALPSMIAARCLRARAASLSFLLLLSFWRDPGVRAKELKFVTLVSTLFSLLFSQNCDQQGLSIECQVPDYYPCVCCLEETKLGEWIIRFRKFLGVKC